MQRSTTYISSAGRFGPTVIDKSQLIKSIGLRLCDHTRTFGSGVRAWYRRTLPAEGILIGIDHLNAMSAKKLTESRSTVRTSTSLPSATPERMRCTASYSQHAIDRSLYA